MPTSYSKFTYANLKKLGIQVVYQDLFQQIQPVYPSELLQQILAKSQLMRLRTEKAKSEFLIAPILLEIADKNPDKVSIFSGYNFDVDKEKGLAGFCDYILSKDVRSPNIEAPVFCVVEAKNEDIEGGVPQCAAEMYAAQIFNQNSGIPGQQIFGCVTTGKEWKFLRLEGVTALLDTKTHVIQELPELLGVLQYIVTYDR